MKRVIDALSSYCIATEKHPNNDPTEFEKIVRSLDSKHCDKVEHLIFEHNRRTSTNANGRESYARLINELKKLK